MLRAIKLDPSSIRKAIVFVDLKTLPKFVLSELQKLVPTEDELATVKQYEKEFQQLGSAEKYIFEISHIPMYEKKLNAMSFKASFSEQKDDVESLVSALKAATEDVLESNKLKEVLKVILALGNYMNPGQRGGAYGFRLGSLAKMMDTKSSVQSRRHTLLHFLVETLESEFPTLADFYEELTNIDEGTKVPIPNIRQGLISIRNSLQGLSVLIKAMNDGSNSSEMSQKFVETMQTFESETTKAYEIMENSFKTVNEKFEKAIELYGEEPKTSTPEEFFGYFAKFCRDYKTAKRDNLNAIAKVAQDKKREAAVKKQEDDRRKKRESQIPKGKENDLDDLISSIRTGKAFGTTPEQQNAVGSIRGRRSLIKKQSSTNMFQIPVQSEQGAVGRLRRTDNADAVTFGKQTKVGGKSDLAKLLATDALKVSTDKDQKPNNLKPQLKSTGIPLKSTASELKSRFDKK